MNDALRRWDDWGRGWMDFWFGLHSLTALALMRIGVGIVLLYSLFVFSFDLTPHLAPGNWGDLAILRRDDPLAWPFSVFDWVDGIGWIWTVHLMAMAIAAAFVMGILPNVTGGALIVLHLSYAHRNPAVLITLDGLLLVALVYLTLSPCGKKLSLLPARRPKPRPYAVIMQDAQPPPSAWGSLILRTMQIHLCALYFLSALASLTPAWLTGEILTRYRMQTWENLEAIQSSIAMPVWAVAFAHGLTLLGLFYVVFVWIPRFRYLLLTVICAAHVIVGLVWGLFAYNALMIVLNVAFVESRQLDWLREKIEPFLALPWLHVNPRG